ncbi:BIR-domain-containing protein [Patellaria atrata CBS 101060]|uniref:BIR-domain-containing protein n=1 Tax=Patellaria atrata CBS 101060 TaxID=1346257 RepID=A0A9P4VNV0_9PEZI|nr:BIR-domain-containing protein [Patellaria atrata CBS 101060]
MKLPEGVNTLIGRLATFQEPVQLPKRRASSTKKKTPSTVSWPHKTPTPEELALAGFFYRPDATSNDNVMCFHCQRKLDGWELGDNAAFEHLAHSPDCSWALVSCIRARVEDMKRVEEDPMSERMVDARTATFGDLWPHENKKGWKCKIQKMVEAGWCFDPSPEFEDGVTCMYCNLSLDGWEPKDNPCCSNYIRDEHYKRSPDCCFFTLVEENKAARKPAAKKGRGSKASRTSRLSTQSTFSEAPSLMSLGGDLPVGLDDSVMTIATVATTTSKAGKGRKAPAKSKAAPKTGKKGTQSKKTTATNTDSIIIDREPLDGTAIEIEYPLAPPPKRLTRRNSNLETSQLENTSILQSTPPRKATRSKKAKVAPKPRLSEDQSQLQSELTDALNRASDSHRIEDERPVRTTRGTKRTSDGLPKVDSSVMVLEDAPTSFIAPVVKPKRTRKGAKKMDEPSELESFQVQIQEEPLPTAKPTRAKRNVKVTDEPSEIIPSQSYEAADEASQPKRAKRTRKAAGDRSELRSSQSIHVTQTLIEPDPEPKTTATANTKKSKNASKKVIEDSLILPDTETMDLDAFPAPPSLHATPARNLPPSTSPQEQPSPAPNPPSPSPIHIAAKEPTRSPPSSPQSSNAENQPPSHPQRTPRVHFPTTTPTPSPSKPPLAPGALTSTTPWNPIDIHTIFLGSPPTNNKDKENENPIPSLTALSLSAAIEKVSATMTEEEKNMNVAQWIAYQALKGEEALRVECEGLVGGFEAEGRRALVCLGGLRV